MTTTQQELLKRLRQTLFTGIQCECQSDEVLKEATAQSVLGHITESAGIVTNNVRVNIGHSSLESVLTVPYVILKGYASAEYYPEPIQRLMGDVDFFVEPADYETAQKNLLGKGFTVSGVNHERHMEFRCDSIVFELHSELKGVPNGRDGVRTEHAEKEEIVRKYLSTIIQKARIVSTPYGIMRLPSYFHHGLVMLLHVAGHIMNDGGIGLRHICDWAVYVARGEFAEYKAEMQEMGLWRFAQLLSLVSVKYLGLPYENWMGSADDSLLEEIMEDFLKAGDLGKKTKKRSAAIDLVQNPLRAVIRRVKYKYPICRKHKVLFPWYIVLYAINHVYRLLTKKTKRIDRTILSDGKKRNSLYSEFRLFDDE